TVITLTVSINVHTHSQLRFRTSLKAAFRVCVRWIKTVAGQDKTKFRGRDRVGWAFTFAAAAYDLVRLPKLMAVLS
ncbi:hypothetical protein SAMN05216228_11071, partial [Rhizobium tibeticum]